MCGRYLVLLRGTSSDIIDGMAYEVLDTEDILEVWDELMAYETDAYSLQSCFVEVDGCEESKGIWGNTFAWAGGEDDEYLTEGTFDLKQWQALYGQN